MCLRLVIRSSPLLLPPSPVRLLHSPLCSARQRLFHRPALGLPRSPRLLPLFARSTPPRFSPHAVNSSSVSALAAILASLIVAGALYYAAPAPRAAAPEHARSPKPDLLPVDDILDYYLAMSGQGASGRPGNLANKEEASLREMWRVMLQLFGVSLASTSSEANGTSAPAPNESPEGKKKKSRLNVFRRKDKETAADAATTNIADFSNIDENDKHGVGKEFKQAIETMTPEELRTAYWSMIKHDNPDAMMLRFLRARKWDVQAAIVMMISAIHWRAVEMHVDDDLMLSGDGGAIKDAEGSDASKKQEADMFLQQLKMGKSYLHGIDKEGRPICCVRVRLHRAGEQSEKSLERFTVYTMETARFLLKPPVDTANVVFDMTDFSLANMDYTPVKFMIKCFEANYPESLGVVLVHKAPWVFQGIWSIIKGWLDPVVAGKVNFTKNYEELSKFIAPSQIPLELGGEEKWEYKYVPPVAGENTKMEDHATRDKHVAARTDLIKQFEEKTIEWIKEGSNSTETADSKAKPNELMDARMKLADSLRTNYWDLDPYIRAKSIYDRTGVISEGGKVDYYPKLDASVNAALEKDEKTGTKADKETDSVNQLADTLQEKKLEDAPSKEPTPVAPTTADDDVD